MKDRLREPSSYIGIGLFFDGVGKVLSGDYQAGVLNIVLGLVGVFMKEGKTNV